MSEETLPQEELNASAERVLGEETSVMENAGAVAPEPAQESDREGHPNLELDPKRAEVMAHASKFAEEAVVGHRNAALSKAMENDSRATQEATNARQVRQQADTIADAAGAVYDSVKDL